MLARPALVEEPLGGKVGVVGAGSHRSVAHVDEGHVQAADLGGVTEGGAIMVSVWENAAALFTSGYASNAARVSNVRQLST